MDNCLCIFTATAEAPNPFEHSAALLHLPHTPDTSVISADVTNNLCVSPGQILRDVAEQSDG